MMAGETGNLKAVDFMQGMSSEALKKELSKALEELKSVDGVIIFADASGGTPFKQAALLSLDNPAIKVIGGANMSLVLDCIFKRDGLLENVIKEVLELNKTSVKLFEPKTTRAEASSSDGI
jgi:PTS system N-acetylgalactosamine-specific IIA component